MLKIMALYHATFLSNLDGIQANGLLPSTGGSSFGAGYGEHSRSRVFFTEADGVFSWHAKVGAQRAPAESAGDLVIVLRVQETDLFDELGLEVEEDEIGTRDVLADAVFVEGEVPAYLLEVWDGKSWVLLEDASTGEMEDFAEERAEVEEDDEEVVWWDEDAFLPPT